MKLKKKFPNDTVAGAAKRVSERLRLRVDSSATGRTAPARAGAPEKLQEADCQCGVSGEISVVEG